MLRLSLFRCSYLAGFSIFLWLFFVLSRIRFFVCSYSFIVVGMYAFGLQLIHHCECIACRNTTAAAAAAAVTRDPTNPPAHLDRLCSVAVLLSIVKFHIVCKH